MALPAPAPAAALPGPMSHPPFRLFWLTRTGSSLAFQMFGVVIAWQMYAITGSALDLGLVGLAQFLPMAVLTLAVGHAADRYDRRTIVRICQAVMSAAALIFIVATLGGWLSRGLIFGLVSVIGAARAFEAPSIMAMLPAAVPREQLQQATAYSTAANQTAQIVGPSLAGLLYLLGPAVVYAVVLCSLIACLFIVAALHVEPQERIAGEPVLRSLFSGIGFVMRSPVILGALSLDLFAVLLGGATALLPIFAQTILNTGPWGLGLLRAAPAVGALTMSIVLARRPLRTRAGITMLGSVALFGLATVIFGLSHNLAVSLIALAVLGASDMVSVVVRISLVQLRTPPVMLGRVSALNALFVGTSNQLGEFESGATAALFGTVPAVLIGGFGTILVAGVWALLFPGLRKLTGLETPALEEGAQPAEQPI